ncbi:MAG TPA: permease prefix domain 1-containing protein, partial [Gemmatimonas sp.]|nr:permease prefix domain 1-containing protein [Gemmatimonas sp.]
MAGVPELAQRFGARVLLRHALRYEVRGVHLEMERDLVAYVLAVRPRIDEDVSDEVAFHLEMHTAHLVTRGMSQEDARAEALRKFGNTSQWS